MSMDCIDRLPSSISATTTMSSDGFVVRGRLPPGWWYRHHCYALAQARQSEARVGGLVLQALLERVPKAGGVG